MRRVKQIIPYGKLTIIQGDPGDGKTTLVLNLAAKLSKGIGLDEDMQVSEPMNIIYQTAEDGLADTVKPRLEAADADCEKIMVIDESEKSLSMVDERLEQAIIQTNARLLILDPIQAYLGGGMDMNRANEARDMTKKLGLLAENYHIHLVFSERKMLEQPEVKIATRNMFYDEQGKHRRTKKEILDEQGNIRFGCSIIPKGEVYESNIFTKKEEWFKNKSFTKEVKELFTDTINCYVTVRVTRVI